MCVRVSAWGPLRVLEPVYGMQGVRHAGLKREHLAGVLDHLVCVKLRVLDRLMCGEGCCITWCV